jgi:hypothetical protein
MVLELNIKPYCNCILSGKHQKQDGYTLDPPSGLWVCSRCRKPSKMNYERRVLGLHPIPQPRKEEDIYDIEQRADRMRIARLEIEKELGWDDDDDDEDY